MTEPLTLDRREELVLGQLRVGYKEHGLEKLMHKIARRIAILEAERAASAEVSEEAGPKPRPRDARTDLKRRPDTYPRRASARIEAEKASQDQRCAQAVGVLAETLDALESIPRLERLRALVREALSEGRVSDLKHGVDTRAMLGVLRTEPISLDRLVRALRGEAL